MRAVVQRASRAAVTVAGDLVGELAGPGLVVLVGVTHTDTPQVAAALAAKIYHVRILAGERSCAQTGAPLLVVSQFTRTRTRARAGGRAGARRRLARSRSRWSAPSATRCERSAAPS